MGTKQSLKISTILKRSKCINSAAHESAASESSRLYTAITNMLESKKTGAVTGVQPLLKSYIEDMCDTSSASICWQPINLIESFNRLDGSAAIADKLSLEFANRILPYLPAGSLEAVSNALDIRNGITDNQKNIVREAIEDCYAADRIITNHRALSKRFNIEESVVKFNRIGLKNFASHYADLVGTYDISDQQKMNIALEEAIYVLEKNGIDFSKKELVEYLIEYYFTQNPSITDKQIDTYCRVLTESPLLEAEDISYATGILENRNVKDYSSINRAINTFLTEANKTPEGVVDVIRVALSNTSTEDISTNIDKLIMLVWDCHKNEIFDGDAIDKLVEAVAVCGEYISAKAINEDAFDKGTVSDIINKISDVSDSIIMIGNTDPEYSKAATQFVTDAITPMLESLTDTKNLLYGVENIEAIRYIKESTETLALNEFRIFKFNNLVKAAFNLDRFLKVKERKLLNKGKAAAKKFIKKAKDVLFGENTDLMNFVGTDSKADICVKQYFYTESEINDISEYLETVCSEYNDLLIAQNETSRVYYILHPGIAEVHIKESTAIEDVDINEAIATLDPVMDTYFDTLGESYFACTDMLKGIVIKSIDEDIATIPDLPDFDIQRFKLVLEAMSIIGIPKEYASRLAEKFNNNEFNQMIQEGTINDSYLVLSKQEKEVEALAEAYEILEDAEWVDKIEAYSYLQTLFEYNYNSSDDENDDDEDEDDDTDDEDEEEYKKYQEEMKKAKEAKKNSGKETEKKSGKKPSEIIPKEEQNYQPDKNPPKNGYKGSFNINSIALALHGLAAKAKEFDHKQREASRNFDAAVRSFTGAVKRMFVSDRREAIIKGNIVPSFSRCIRAGIVLAGVGVVTANPAIPVIAAIGGLALSKKLTDKERMALCDEIETELEVVEKELAIADSNNNMNKYRTLLLYKKELQRQYQRIVYNVKLDKGGKGVHVKAGAGVNIGASVDLD